MDQGAAQGALHLSVQTRVSGLPGLGSRAAQRLHPCVDRAPGVVDEGITGNRVLSDSSCFGLSALTRFERDALSEPGVRAVYVELDRGIAGPRHARQSMIRKSGNRFSEKIMRH